MAAKTFAGGKSDSATAEACAATLRVRNAGNVSGGSFDGPRAVDKDISGGLRGILHVQIRQ